ncbi:general secretion pathway protein GspK [Horticoccus luteus]|uniref:General secretion pathway protein GspK n=1 Tax=Horticoccus luteus TaxID=2862869 RepID=A0A8F9XKS0_9BACT|nr:type II secretion system protein GspK [Horticoccus luteus]QYM78339.1 general secretion pathway protein GspK [Horticoccus luteus]
MRALSKRGSVLIVVMVTLLGAVFALMVFAEKASNDLLVETRVADSVRLRQEAYSAVETTLSVLEEFRRALGGLHSPSEGWGDPLAFAGYTPTEGRQVEVSFEDESGKLSLPTVDGPMLINVFKSWDVRQMEAEQLSDALITWMSKDALKSNDLAIDDYEHATLPYEAPKRSLRSFDELRDIAIARDFFYDKAGRPNERWLRFTQMFSLYKFTGSNLNSAPADVFAALGVQDARSVEEVRNYLSGTGSYALQGPQWFRSAKDAAPLLGGQSVPAGFSTDIRALRVKVTVRQGPSIYRMSVLITPGQNGAEAVGLSDLEKAKSETARATAPAPTPATPDTKKLKYPFTLLEIRENDAPAVVVPVGD